MNNGNRNACLLGTILLLSGASGATQAADFSGTLAFDAHPAIPVTLTLPLVGETPAYVGVDLQRFDLGSNLDGGVDMTFTTHNAYSDANTVLALVFATDPNDAIVSDPSSLASFVNPNTDVTTFMNDNVTGWTYYAWGNVIVSNGTTVVSDAVDTTAIFNPPMNFTAGTHYYAFVAGGSAFLPGSTLTDTSLSYTLSVPAVAAVPEPESWATMIAGLGLVGLYLRRRRNA